MGKNPENIPKTIETAVKIIKRESKGKRTRESILKPLYEELKKFNSEHNCYWTTFTLGKIEPLPVTPTKLLLLYLFRLELKKCCKINTSEQLLLEFVCSTDYFRTNRFTKRDFKNCEQKKDDIEKYDDDIEYLFSIFDKKDDFSTLLSINRFIKSLNRSKFSEIKRLIPLLIVKFPYIDFDECRSATKILKTFTADKSASTMQLINFIQTMCKNPGGFKQKNISDVFSNPTEYFFYFKGRDVLLIKFQLAVICYLEGKYQKKLPEERLLLQIAFLENKIQTNPDCSYGYELTYQKCVNLLDEIRSQRI